MDEVTHYCGKRIDDMSKEELVAALKVMGRLYSQALERALVGVR